MAPLLLLLATRLALVAHIIIQVNAQSTSSSSNPQASGLAMERVATTWYAGFHAEDYPISKVSWSKYTQVTYAFATTTPDVHVLALQDSDVALLPQFVKAAHDNGVKASLSIGGWTGSQWYSTNVASAANRTTFVKTVINLAKKYKLDGIDFDWEYPGNQGLGCNVINPKDSANFLSFLQELRQDPLGRKLILSAATATVPFIAADGNPSADVSQFSNVLDYIAVMNYDIWGSWTPVVGPNAPLDDSCTQQSYQLGSAISAVKAWNRAGIPLNQIVLGVASYGHSFRVSPANAYKDNSHHTLALYPQFDAKNQPTGDSWDDAAGLDPCGKTVGVGGVWNFWGLIQAGYLKSDGTVANGVAYQYDNCSQTPFIYIEQSQTMVSFDDARSFAAKGNFIKTEGLRGFAMWEAGGDYNDILLDAIQHPIMHAYPMSMNEPSLSSTSPAVGQGVGIRTYLDYLRLGVGLVLGVLITSGCWNAFGL